MDFTRPDRFDLCTVSITRCPHANWLDVPAYIAQSHSWLDKKAPAALQLVAGLVMVPIPNIASRYCSGTGSSVACRRQRDDCLILPSRKPWVPSAPRYGKYDRDIAPFPLVYPIMVLLFIPMGLDGGSLVPWLMSLIATALTVKAFFGIDHGIA